MAMLYCAYGLLCFLATQTPGPQLRRHAKLPSFMAIYGFVLAAFALMQGVAPNGKLYWVRQPRLGGWIYGSYVNHNHYAGLMELLIPIPLVLALSHSGMQKERLAAGVAAAIMVGTVFLSGSRGGMIAIFVELVVVAVVRVSQTEWTSYRPRQPPLSRICCCRACSSGLVEKRFLPACPASRPKLAAKFPAACGFPSIAMAFQHVSP